MASSQATLKLLIVAVAVCGLAAAQTSYGTVYGDTGVDAPYVQSLSPPEGPKQGGTVITVQGAGFNDDARLSCRFSRLDPETEMTVTKETSASYVSSTEITCPAPEWDEGDCPSCSATSHTLSGNIYGHTGSPYLRADDKEIVKEIGVGDYITFAGATVGKNTLETPLTQYFEVSAIEECGSALGNLNGCHCGGGGTWRESAYSVATTYNGSGTPISAPNSGFEIVTATDTNCALYVYDRITGGARSTNTGSQGSSLWRQNDATVGRFYGAAGTSPTTADVVGDGCANIGTACIGGAWTGGAKITLSEPVYKIDGRANVGFGYKSTNWGHTSGSTPYADGTAVTAKRASKFSCTSCKCKGGCAVTVTVTNDGKKFSGSGLGGKVWAGTGAMFALKDIVPTVNYIDHGLPGYRDSTRIMGPATGGTTITVVGENFQDSPLLRCYFAGVHTLVKAEWLSSTKVRCKTPDFFSRQIDISTTKSNQDGSAKNPHSKVHVTNDGMISVMETEDDAAGHISQNPHLAEDGSFSYIGTFDKDNSYTSGLTGAESNPFRSTCQAGLYPNEGMAPCWNSHDSTLNEPLSCSGESRSSDLSCSSTAQYSAGNDVLFKYATCYDANPAKAVDDLNLYAGTTSLGKAINSTSTIGQQITIGTDAADELQAGPLAYLELHLKKLDQEESTLEVSVLSGGWSYSTSSGVNTGNTPGTVISKETITVSKIEDTTDYAYPVFFTNPPYLLNGVTYYVEIKHIDGSGNTQWMYTDTDNTGAYAHIGAAIGSARFKLKGYTCDGCRTKYVFDPTVHPETTLKFGSYTGTQDTGSIPNTAIPSALATVNGAVTASASVTLSASNSAIQPGQVVTGTGLIGTITVVSITGTSLVMSSAQTIASGVQLTFSHTNPNNVVPGGDIDQSNAYVADGSHGVSTNLHAGTYRSMLAQEFRPTETATVTHVSLKLQNVMDNNIDQADVSIWVTQHGKYGEYVCSQFGGLLEAGYYGNTMGSAANNHMGNPGGAEYTGTNYDNNPYMGDPLNICDTNYDGVFNEECGLGAVCDPNMGLNGGCGYRGACTLAETVLHGHRLRPGATTSSSAGTITASNAAPCGDDVDCDLTNTLNPDHMKFVSGLTSAAWVEFEFATAVPVEKHTTYFINVAVVGNPDYSKEMIWVSGNAYGDGGVTRDGGAALDANFANEEDTAPSDELRASFIRGVNDWRWTKNSNKVMATKIKRCVSSTAQVMGFHTSGEKTGCCSARASPQGGDKGATVTITGRNFFPSDDLRCIFRNEDGTTGAVVTGTVLDASYTKMSCEAPTLDPHSARDCTNPALCQGTELVVTNQYPYVIGPQFMSPKWISARNPTDGTPYIGTPGYLGLNPLLFLFSDIYVSPTGSDTVGDGTIARPYQTIQRAVDAANENDQIILLAGYYTGLGNRGLRHHGKKIQMRGYQAEILDIVIDCEHAPDGFILNNNKDSDSPFAGYIDTQDIVTKNCENLRIYDI